MLPVIQSVVVTVYYQELIVILNGLFSNLVLGFHKVGGLKIFKIKAAEMSWLKILSIGQAPKTLDPTFPIMQLNFVLLLDPVW